MHTGIRKGVIALIALCGPVAVWVALVALAPHFPGLMDPWAGLFDLVVLLALAVAGFKLVVRIYPSHIAVAALVYFPVVVLLMIYLGIVIEWRLDPSRF
jgi:hypothetical protein